MTPPVIASLKGVGYPNRLTIFLKTMRMAVPIRMPIIEPSPPLRLHPPSTAAAIA